MTESMTIALPEPIELEEAPPITEVVADQAATEEVVKPAPKARKPRAPKTAKPAAPAAPATPAPKAKATKDPNVKTWTLTAIEVKAAADQIKGILAGEPETPKGLKLQISIRSKPAYPTSRTAANGGKAQDGDAETERMDYSPGTNHVQVKTRNYVAHLLFVRRNGEVYTSWTVWLSDEGPVLLARDGRKVK